MPDNDPGLADTLGKGYAHLQHWMDLGIEWGMKKMKEAEKTTPPTKKKSYNPYVAKAESAVRKTLGFIGSMGDSYYTTYESLKRKK